MVVQSEINEGKKRNEYEEEGKVEKKDEGRIFLFFLVVVLLILI